MTMPETLLILDDQPEVTELLARTLASPGRTIITAHDCEAASLILERVPVALLISDVHFSTRFAFEGLSLIDEVRKSSPATRILMISADSSEGLSREAERRGAVGLMEKPFDVPLLKQAVASLVEGCHRNGEASSVIRVPLLERLILERRILPHFQPIVDLSIPEARAYGFESLARPQVEGVPFFDCDFLFKYAERKQMIVALDLLCLQQALWWGAPLARAGKLFINIHPQLLSGCAELSSVVLGCARKSDIPLGNIVLEITEQGRLAETAGSLACIETLRDAGVQFALDDVGMSYSHLDLMDWIKPSYLKISQHFGTRFELDSSKGKIVRNIVSLATEFDCEVILEGIEEVTTSGAATRAGARFGQGFYYARPQTAATFQ
ncbi:MAG TPA: EAL domain-containing response regulator [Thermoanaerobaculia bacterium]|nr:EAL domain-containing response regulator [Thermoanaerobaculia bacterium]